MRPATHSGDAVEEASDASFPASDPPSLSTDDPHAAPAPAVPVGVPDDTREYLPVEVEVPGGRAAIRTGSVAIAAITSCTNTSNPTVMIGAGLLARNAVARGLRGRADRQDLAGAGLQGGHRATSRRPA